MRELHVVALSEDGRHVLLATSPDAVRGGFRVPLDDRLLAAVRGDLPRPGSVREVALPVKEIQARLRAGESPEDIARSAGTPVARIERWAGPVQSEKDQVVLAAWRSVVVRGRRGPSAVPLGEAVERHLRELPSLKPDSVQWTAWRGDEPRWTVQVSWFSRGKTRVAQWHYETHSRLLTPADSGSAALGHIDDDGSGGASESETAGRPTPARRAAAPRPATPRPATAASRQSPAARTAATGAAASPAAATRSASGTGARPAASRTTTPRTTTPRTATARSASPRTAATGAGRTAAAGTAASRTAASRTPASRPAAPAARSAPAPSAAPARPATTGRAVPAASRTAPPPAARGAAARRPSARSGAPGEDGLLQPSTPARGSAPAEAPAPPDAAPSSPPALRVVGDDRPAPPRRKGRASVPSWEDVLLSTGSHDDGPPAG